MPSDAKGAPRCDSIHICIIDKNVKIEYTDKQINQYMYSQNDR